MRAFVAVAHKEDTRALALDIRSPNVKGAELSQVLTRMAQIHLPPNTAGLLAACSVFAIAIPAFIIVVASDEISNYAYGLAGVLGAAMFNIAFFATVFMVFAALPLRPLRLACFWGFTVAIAGFMFVYIYHFLLYKQLLGGPGIAAVMDTNARETIEFLYSVTVLRYVCFSLIAVLVLLCTAAPAKHYVTSGRTISVSSATMLVLFASILFYIGISKQTIARCNPLFLTLRLSYIAYHDKKSVEAAMEELSKVKSHVVTPPPEQSVTHILIIGEATTSKHMSLYGYERETSPQLRGMESQIHVARDVCSSRGATSPALKEMLTFATRLDAEPLRTSPNLLQILRAAGFKVFWLSNQQMSGKFDNWSGVFAKSADERVFVNRTGWIEGSSLDELLFEPLRTAIADSAERKFIVMHLLGAHEDYKMRYPKEFNIFSDLPRLWAHDSVPTWLVTKYNHYDNAILYDDHVVASIIRMAMTLPSATVTFLSDHGEAVGEKDSWFGHFDGPAPSQVYRIPLLFYISDQIQRRLGGLMSNFEANLSLAFQSDALIHVLLDLYGVVDPMRRDEKSLFSPTYQPLPRYCDELDVRIVHLQ